jgi:hypothetical protein
MGWICQFANHWRGGNSNKTATKANETTASKKSAHAAAATLDTCASDDDERSDQYSMTAAESIGKHWGKWQSSDTANDLDG